MWTIVTIGLAGALGGFVSTVLPAGTDVPFPSALETPLGSAGWLTTFVGHVLVNAMVGAFVAIVLWAAVDPTATTLTGTAIQPKQIATAAGIGLAGIAIAKKIQQQATDATDWKAAFQQVAAAANQLKSKQPL